MKKILTIAIIALAMLALFTSCQKEKSLAGTNWKYYGTGGTVELLFTSETSATINIDLYSGAPQLYPLTYTYADPSITLYEAGAVFGTGQVSKTTMTLTINGINGLLSFTKQ